MNNMMWFGNRNYMQWVRCPEVSADYGSQGTQHKAQYLNGGAFNRQTFSAAKSYRLTWSQTGAAEIRKITDYVEGVYGEGPIFWTDPFLIGQNMLPQSWATPALGARDGITLDGSDTRPDLIPTDTPAPGMPRESAVYQLKTGTRPELWIPVPPGYGAIFYWIGSWDGTAGVGVSATASAIGACVPGEIRAYRASQITGGGIKIGMRRNGTVTVAAMSLIILPDAEVNRRKAELSDGGAGYTTGKFWTSGQGNSGVSFDGYPTKEMYSAAFDMVGLTAQFVETGQWQ